MFNKTVGTLYVFDYYSSTTQQHIRKFSEMLEWDRIIYLYKRSDGVLEKMRYYLGSNGYFKPYKHEWVILYDHDFSMEITTKWD